MMRLPAPIAPVAARLAVPLARAAALALPLMKLRPAASTTASPLPWAATLPFVPSTTFCPACATT